jgi:hypothetical protein
MNTILYSHGDSVVWGAELETKETERFSNIICQRMGWLDCNNASAGVSNDYIYRQTLRDISHWRKTGNVWSEETGWVHSQNIRVIIGWTSPTRFEWWNGSEYQQERLWTGYDKWGTNDTNRTTEDQFVINQTELIPSYIKTLNHIIGLRAFLEKNGIPYYFFNSFYKWERITEPVKPIDKFGRPEYQLDINSLYTELPTNFFGETMYKYIERNGGGFLPRNHPTKESHQIWADYLVNEI